MKEHPTLPDYQYDDYDYDCYPEILRKPFACIHIEKQCQETGRWKRITDIKLCRINTPAKHEFFNGYTPATFKYRFKNEEDMLKYCKRLCDYYGSNTRMYYTYNSGELPAICGPTYRKRILYQEGKWI